MNLRRYFGLLCFPGSVLPLTGVMCSVGKFRLERGTNGEIEYALEIVQAIA